MDKLPASLISFVISFGIFYFLMLSIISKEPNKIKTDTVVEVDFLVEMPPEPEKKPEKKQKTKSKQSIKSLFGKTKKTNLKELTKHDYKLDKIKTRKTNIDYKKLFKKKQIHTDTTIVKKDKELKDKYLSMLHSRLMEVWQTRPEDANKKAQIIFTISTDGSFVYYFKNISPSVDFKYRLEESIKTLKEQGIPKPKSRLRVEVHFIAKE